MADYDPARDYTFHRLDERPRYSKQEHIGGYAVVPPENSFPGKDTKPTLWIRCPGEDEKNEHGKCGWLLYLDHGINEDGEVQPSVGCPHCGFHAWVTLEGWDQGTYDPNGHL